MKKAATLQIKKSSKMSKRGHKKVVKWLKRQVRFFEKYPEKLGDRFSANYFYK